MTPVQNTMVFLCLFLGPVFAAMLPPIRERKSAAMALNPPDLQEAFALPMVHRFTSASLLEARDRRRIRDSFPPRPARAALLIRPSAFRNPSNPL